MLAARIAADEENAHASVLYPAKEQDTRMSAAKERKKPRFYCAFWDKSYGDDGVTEIVVQRGKSSSQAWAPHHVCLPGV